MAENKNADLLKEDFGFALYKIVGCDGDVYYKVNFPDSSDEHYLEDFEVFVDYSKALLFYDAFKRGYVYAKSN